MSTNRLPLRLLLIAVLAIGAALAVGLVVGALNSVLEFHARVMAMPLWLRLPLIVAAACAIGGLGLLFWRLARPARRRLPPLREPPQRAEVDARVEALRQREVDTAALEAELHELDRRRADGEVYVAVFGEISTGKSSLIGALAPDQAPATDPRGGTTRRVATYRGRLASGRSLVLADVPGTGEVDGAAREALARDEALRAHVVAVVAASDLTARQDRELRWLAGFGKPLLLVLNKIDQFDAAERHALIDALERRYAGLVAALVPVSAGGLERFERRLADGRIEKIERERLPAVEPLAAALDRYAAHGAAALEPAREAAVLTRVEERRAALEREAAAREADAIVLRYTRRAVVGAMAAVAPGSDLVIQGALGTALIRELAAVHGVPVRELAVDDLLKRLGLTVRNATAVVLAIAGNAFKAFPGLGTLGGGVLHAVAYGLVFDSVGRAVSASLAEKAAFDQADAERRVRELLAEPGRERLERVARIVLDAVRGSGTTG